MNSTALANEKEINRLKADCARRYIAHIDEVKKQVADLEDGIERIQAAAEGVRGLDYSRDKVSTSSSGDSMEKAVIRLIEAKESNLASLEFEKREIEEFNARIAALRTRGGLILQFLYGLAIPINDAQIYCSYMPMPKTTYFRRKDDGLVELYDNGLPVEYRIPDEKAI